MLHNLNSVNHDINIALIDIKNADSILQLLATSSMSDLEKLLLLSKCNPGNRSIAYKIALYHPKAIPDLLNLLNNLADQFSDQLLELLEIKTANKKWTLLHLILNVNNEKNADAALNLLFKLTKNNPEKLIAIYKLQTSNLCSVLYNIISKQPNAIVGKALLSLEKLIYTHGILVLELLNLTTNKNSTNALGIALYHTSPCPEILLHILEILTAQFPSQVLSLLEAKNKENMSFIPVIARYHNSLILERLYLLINNLKYTYHLPLKKLGERLKYTIIIPEEQEVSHFINHLITYHPTHILYQFIDLDIMDIKILSTMLSNYRDKLVEYIFSIEEIAERKIALENAKNFAHPLGKILFGNMSAIQKLCSKKLTRIEEELKKLNTAPVDNYTLWQESESRYPAINQSNPLSIILQTLYIPPTEINNRQDILVQHAKKTILPKEEKAAKNKNINFSFNKF